MVARDDAGKGNAQNPAETRDRRGFRRVGLRRQVLLRLSAELTFRGFLQNISQDAVQVLCEPRYALLIHPQGDGAAPHEEQYVEISVALPDGAGLGNFTARCRVKYCVRFDDRYMVLGLQFVGTDTQSVQRLDRFLQTNSDPDTDR